MTVVTGWTAYLATKESYTGTNTTPSRTLGSGAGYAKYGQSFTAASSYSMGQIIVSLNKYGTPTDNVGVEIWSDSSGSPGSLITNGTSSTIAGGDLTTSYQDITLTFATPPSISNTTVYWIVFGRSGAVDANNFFRIGGVASGGSGLMRYTPWTSVANNQAFYTNKGSVANKYQAALTSEPTDIYFDGTAGTKRTSIANLTTNNDWYWASNVLYIYSSTDPATRHIDTLPYVTGTVAITLAPFTVATAGGPKVTGTTAPAIAPVTVSAAGQPVVNGTAAIALAPVTTEMTGETSVTGVTGIVAATLAQLTAEMAGSPVVTGTATPSLAPLTTVMAGQPVVTGTATPSLAPVVAAMSGQPIVEGTAAVDLAEVTASLDGSPVITGTVTSTLAPITLEHAGQLLVEGTTDINLAPVTADIAGSPEIIGTVGIIEVTLAQLTASMEGSPTVSGTVAPELSPLTATVAGQPEIEGSTAITLAPVTVDIAGSPEITGVTGIITAALNPLTASLSGEPIASGTMAVTLSSVETVTGRIDRGPTEMILKRNTAGQYLYIYAHDTDADAPKTGDAANITAYLIKDNGSAVQTNDVNPTEVDAVNAPGTYRFTMTQAETDFDVGRLQSTSTTSDVYIAPVDLSTSSSEWDALTINHQIDGSYGKLLGALKSMYAWVRSA